MHLQETNIRTLELLEKFKYLTNSQLIKLGVASSQPSMGRILQRFFKNKDGDIRYPLVTKIIFAVDPQKGKLEHLYCLNKRGASFLAEYLDVDLTQINYIKGSGFLNKDYFHRVAQINYHIDLHLDSIQNDFTIDFFDNYFDKIGSNNSNQNQMLEAKTKLFYNDGSWYIPDGIIKTSKILKDGKNQDYYKILEIHCGNDTKRAIQTIEKNVRALVDGSIAKKYGYKFTPTVVIVFDNEEIKENVEKRLSILEKFKNFEEFLEFKTL